jgi:hypothetical protein
MKSDVSSLLGELNSSSDCQLTYGSDRVARDIGPEKSDLQSFKQAMKAKDLSY